MKLLRGVSQLALGQRIDVKIERARQVLLRRLIPLERTDTKLDRGEFLNDLFYPLVLRKFFLRLTAVESLF